MEKMDVFNESKDLKKEIESYYPNYNLNKASDILRIVRDEVSTLFKIVAVSKDKKLHTATSDVVAVKGSYEKYKQRNIAEKISKYFEQLNQQDLEEGKIYPNTPCYANMQVLFVLAIADFDNIIDEDKRAFNALNVANYLDVLLWDYKKTKIIKVNC